MLAESFFFLAKIMLLHRVHHFLKGVRLNIPELIIWIHEVVTGIDITIMLNNGCFSACFCKYTHRCWQPHPGHEGTFKIHDIDFADIISHPLIKDRNQKISVFFRIHRPWCQMNSFFVNRSRSRMAQPSVVACSSANLSTIGIN